MQIKCTYCGQYMSDTDSECPYCGAPNDFFKRTANDVPTTIEELKAWALEKKYPLDKMRVFIGIDYKNPKAFGIYKDEASGNFIVYKNKADGTRAIRYEGKDEAYAVNELYMKIKEEGLKHQEFQKQNLAGQQSFNKKNDTQSRVPKTNNKKIISFLFFLFLFLLFSWLTVKQMTSHSTPHSSIQSTYFGEGGNNNDDWGGTTWYGDDDDDDRDSWDNNDSWDSDWDSDWSSDWDSDWSSDWDSDWDSDW